MAHVLGAPALASKQYNKGLESTVVPLRDELGTTQILERPNFSAAADGTPLRVPGSDHRQLVVYGNEAHVCVL